MKLFESKIVVRIDDYFALCLFMQLLYHTVIILFDCMTFFNNFSCFNRVIQFVLRPIPPGADIPDMQKQIIIAPGHAPSAPGQVIMIDL